MPIRRLHAEGLKVRPCLTGDSAGQAQAVASQSVLDAVHADVSPEEYKTIVRELQAPLVP